MHILLIGVLAAAMAWQDESPGPDFTRLSQPAVATQLGLSDEQRSQIQSLLTDRINELAAAPPAERDAIRARNNQLLSAVLTDEQRSRFSSLVVEGMLRFNFRGEEWGNVLDWFARQSNLSLVMDAAPPGEFSYSDTREYTPAQAIDLLNSVLVSKGFTLIRREQMLIVAELSDGLPYDLVPEITVEELSGRGRFEWVRIAFPLGTRPVDAVMAEINPILSQYGKATPLATSRKLLVTETAGKMNAINMLIAAVPEPEPPAKPEEPKPPPPRIFLVYPAKGVDIAAAVPTLQALFPDANFFGDAQAEQIQVHAVQAEQDLIRNSIDQMVRNASTDLVVQTEIYAVDAGSMDQVTGHLQSQFPDASISPDPAQDRIIISATARDHESIRATLQKLGYQSAGDISTESVEIHAVPGDQGDGIASMLMQMIPNAQVVAQGDRVAVRGSDRDQEIARSLIQQLALTDDPSRQKSLKYYPAPETAANAIESLQVLVPEATITVLADQDRISVIATGNDHQLIEQTLQRITTELPSPVRRSLKIYPVTEPQKARFAELVRESSTDFKSAKMVTDANPREIAVWATDQEHAAIAAILDEIRQVEPEVMKELRRFSVEVADPDQLLSLLAERHPDLRMIPAAAADAVLVWGDVDQLDQVGRSIEELTAMLPARETRTLEVYPLNGPLSQATAVIAPVQGDASVTADEAGQRLIVWAMPEEHKAIAGVLQKFGELAPRPHSLEVYPLGGIPVADARQMIAPVMGNASVTADESGTSLLVWASAGEHKKIKQTLATASGLAARDAATIDIYPIDPERVDEVLATIQSVLPEASVTRHPTGGRIIVVAKPPIQEQVAALVARLQGTAPVHKVLMAYPLKHAEASALLPMLQDLRKDVLFAADDRSNRILVTADLTEQLRLKAIIEQLDAEDTDPEMLQAYAMQEISPSLVSELLQPLLSRMQFSIDEKNGKLLARGSARDHRKLTLIVEQIRTDASGEKSVTTHSIGNADPAAIDNVLQQLVPSATFSINPATRSVVVWGTAGEQARIADALEQLAAVAVAQAMNIRAYDLARPVTRDIADMLQSLSPTAKVSLSSDARQVVILATPQDHPMFAAVIEDLQSAPDRRENLQLKAYSAESIVISAAEPVIRDALPLCRIVAQPDPERLLIWATAAEHEQIATIVDDLTQQILAPGEPQSIRIYPLNGIDYATAIRLIGEDARSASVLDSSDARQLVIRAGEPAHTNVAAILEQLGLVFQAVRQKAIQSHAVRNDLKDQVIALAASTLPAVEFLNNNEPDSLLARGTRQDHQSLESLITQMEQEIAKPVPRRLVAYPLERVSRPLVTRILGNRFPNLTFEDSSNPNQLIVWALDEQHAEIPAILEGLEETLRQDDQRVVTVYPVDQRQLSADKVLSLLDATLRENTSIQVSTETNSLIVRASPERHASIAKAIDAIVRQLPPAVTPTVRLYDLGDIDADTVFNLLTPLLPANTLTLSADGKQLMATGFDHDHRIIQSVVDQLRAVDAGAGMSTRVYRMETAIASTVAPAIEAMAPSAIISADDPSQTLIVSASDDVHRKIANVLDQINDTQLGRKTEVYVPALADPASLVSAIISLIPDASATADTRTNSVIVTAKPADFTQIQTIVDKLDAASQDKFGDVVARVYPFDPDLVDAAAMQDVLDPDLVAAANIRVNEVGNGLIIRTTPEKHEQIRRVLDAVLEQLPADRQVTTRVYPLKSIDPASMTSILGALLGRRQFAVDATTGTVVATVTETEHAKIASIIAQMESSGAAEGHSTRVYPLTSALPSVVATAVTVLTPEAKVVSSDSTRALIVSASAEDHQKISSVIDQINNTRLGRETEVYVPRLADPVSLVSAIKSLIPDASATADVKTGSVIVTAKSADFTQIQAIVDKLDAASEDKFGDLVAKVYPFDPDVVDAAAMRDVIDPDLLADATVQVNEVANGLIIRATADRHRQYQAIFDAVLEQLPEDARVSTKVYALNRIDPVAMRGVLASLFAANQFAVDTTNRVVVATVSENDHARIAAIIEQMRSADIGQGTSQAFRVSRASVKVVAEAIQSLLPLAQVSSDDATRTVIVTASKAELESVSELIRQVDGSGSGQVTEFYRLTTANPNNVAPAIAALLPGAVITPDANSKSIFVTANPADQATAAEVIDKLNGVSAGQTTEVYSLLNADAAAVLPALESLVPDGLVTADETSNSLVVIASPGDQATVRELVGKLDTVPGRDPVLKIYRSQFENDEPLFQAMQGAFGDDDTVRISYDWESRRITAIAPETKHQLIQKLIEEVDQPRPQREPRVPRVYPVGNIDGSAAEGTIRDLIRDMEPRVEVRLDTGSNALIVMATQRQHPEIAQTLEEIDRDTKQLEVFQLYQVDPITIELAITELFADLPPETMPSATTDVDTQQLFVRGSRAQIAQVRGLLEKMGETTIQPGTRSNGAVRTIPFRGNVLDAIREIESIWPPSAETGSR